MNTTELQVTIIVTINYEHGMHNTAQARYTSQQWESTVKISKFGNKLLIPTKLIRTNPTK